MGRPRPRETVMVAREGARTSAIEPSVLGPLEAVRDGGHGTPGQRLP